jgi:hypothetical protein
MTGFGKVAQPVSVITAAAANAAILNPITTSLHSPVSRVVQNKNQCVGAYLSAALLR